MQFLPVTLETVKKKLDRLINKYELTKEELRHVKEENQELMNLIKEKEDVIHDFQNREKINKIVSHVADEGGEKITELKQKINEYIKEIDRCIAHLSE